MKQEIDIERILEKVDLVQLAERAGAKLKKSGGGYRGACPLHGGDNPTAFTIYTGKDNRQRWHCHTHCGGGDAIDFVRAWHHLPDTPEGFVEAVRLLAEYASLPTDDLGLNAEEARQAAERRQARRKRQDLLTVAARYYARLLRSPSGKAGRDYAQKRGWTDKTIREMGLGYSDGRLLDYLQELEADLDLALKTGLIAQRKDGTLADVIPSGYLVYTHHLHKQVTYLSGRATFNDDPDKKARNLKAPKRLFWALRDHEGPLVIVEGQACAITAWQWGYSAVALCGLHLNEQDAESIREYPAVYLALDSDAGDRVTSVADALGPLAMIVSGVPRKDLNAWLTEAEATAGDLAGLIEKARPWIEVTIEQARKVPAYELEDHLEHLAELVAQLTPTMRSRYVREICDRRLSATREFQRLVDTYDQSSSNADDNGFEVKNGQLTHYGQPLINAVPRISHELIQDDGLNPPSIVYTIEGILDSGEKLEAIEIKAEDFETMRWIPRHWGARPILYVSPGKTYLLRRAIQEISRAELQRERVHTFTGWVEIEGRRLFLTTAGGLGVEGLDPSVRVDLGNNNLGRYALPAPPNDLRPAIQASFDFLNLGPLGVTLPLWAAMYAAPLSPFRTLNAVLWVYGTTQSGKSTIAHLALAHLGPTFVDGHEYRAPKDWTSTPTDLERAMFVTKDAPIILDDYAPAHSGAAEARQMAKKAHYVVRSVGNRSSRGRANPDLTERQQRPPRGLVIATAENPLIGQSIVGRMIYVPVEPGDIIEEEEAETALDTAQQQAMDGLYAQAMSGYVVWLARQWDRLRNELPEQIKRASRVGRSLFPHGQSRLTDYYGLLVTTTDLALDYAAEQGALSAEATEGLKELFRHTLIDLLRLQSERVATQSPALKFFQALSDLLAQEKVYFAPRKSDGFFPPERADRIGWYDEERKQVYLLTNAALARAKDYWQALDERFDTLADALRRELWQQGYVAKREKEHFEKKAYINREVGRLRVLVLDAALLLEKTGINLTGNEAYGQDDEV